MEKNNNEDNKNEFSEQVSPKNESKNFLTIIWSGIRFFFTHPNFKYSAKRILSSIFTLLLVCGAVFLLLRLVPKDGYYDQGVIQKLGNETAVQVYKKSIDEKYGFDKPILQQLGNFYWDILPIPRTYCIRESYTDNTYSERICSKSEVHIIYLGQSLSLMKGKTVTEILGSRMGISFKISIIATILTYIIAYPMGVIMAKRKGKWQDKLGNLLIVLNYAIPGLVFYLVIWRLGLAFGLPAYYNEKASSLIIPIFAMVFLGVPGQAMWVRRFMVDEGDADYVKFARSKGLSENRIMYTHVLRNAVVPLVRNLPAAFIGAFIGGYFVEKVWSIPGTGKLLLDALNPTKPDNPLVQGLTIVYAAISMISFLLGDIVTMFADPRIKLAKD